MSTFLFLLIVVSYFVDYVHIQKDGIYIRFRNT